MTSEALTSVSNRTRHPSTDGSQQEDPCLRLARWRRVEWGAQTATDGADWLALDLGTDGSAREILEGLRDQGVSVELTAPGELGGRLTARGSKGICLLCCIAGRSAPDAEGVSTVEKVGAELASVLAKLAVASAEATITLCLVTCGAEMVTEEDVELSALGAASRAIVACFAREQPGVRTMRVDLSVARAAAAVPILAEILQRTEANRAVAIREGALFERRWGEWDPPSATNGVAPRGPSGPARERAFALRVRSDSSGRSIAFEWQHVSRSRAAPGEVEIETLASSLDPYVGVRSDLGYTGPIGWGCVGRVTGLGEGVRGGLKVGALVAAMAAGSASRFVNTNAALVTPLHNDADVPLTAANIASVVVALYVLQNVARARAGDHVLVLGAATPVGLAALRIARRLGATVTAEDPSPEGRAWLARQSILRSLDGTKASFVQDLMEVPRGNRVDLVLATDNRPAPDLRRFCAAGAHYVRIVAGPNDVTPSVERGIATAQLDPLELMQTHPQACASLLRSAVGILGELAMPKTSLLACSSLNTTPADLGRAQSDLFALTFADAASADIAELEMPASRIRSDGAYLVAGGTGGLGIEIAKWLVRSGAGCIVLASRHEPTFDALLAIDWMRRTGAHVRWIATDLSSAPGVESLLGHTCGDHPLRGILVASGARDEGPAHELDSGRLGAALGAKCLATLNLLRATAPSDLDFFGVATSLAHRSGRVGSAAAMAADAATAAFLRSPSFLAHPVRHFELAPIAERVGSVDPTHVQPVQVERACEAIGTMLRAGASSAVVTDAIIGDRCPDALVFESPEHADPARDARPGARRPARRSLVVSRGSS